MGDSFLVFGANRELPDWRLGSRVDKAIRRRRMMTVKQRLQGEALNEYLAAKVIGLVRRDYPAAEDGSYGACTEWHSTPNTAFLIPFMGGGRIVGEAGGAPDFMGPAMCAALKEHLRQNGVVFSIVHGQNTPYNGVDVMKVAFAVTEHVPGKLVGGVLQQSAKSEAEAVAKFAVDLVASGRLKEQPWTGARKQKAN